MGYIDRGPRFAAYYKVDVTSPAGLLYGVQWENSQDCGTFNLDGKTYKLRCIHFYKDEFPDCHGVNGESFDISSWDIDGLATDPVVAALMMGMMPDLSTLHPVAAALVQQDLDAGLDGEAILETRAAIFGDFMGFTIGHVKMVLPSESYQVDTGEVDADSSPIMQDTITTCSLESVN